MPKIKTTTIKTNHDGLIVTSGWGDEVKPSTIRNIIHQHYIEKFFNKFLNKFENEHYF